MYSGTRVLISGTWRFFVVPYDDAGISQLRLLQGVTSIRLMVSARGANRRAIRRALPAVGPGEPHWVREEAALPVLYPTFLVCGNACDGCGTACRRKALHRYVALSHPPMGRCPRPLKRILA